MSSLEGFEWLLSRVSDIDSYVPQQDLHNSLICSSSMAMNGIDININETTPEYLISDAFAHYADTSMGNFAEQDKEKYNTMKQILSKLLDSTKEKGDRNRLEQFSTISHFLQIYPETILNDLNVKISSTLTSLTSTCFTTLLSGTKQSIDLSDTVFTPKLIVNFQGICNIWYSLIKRITSLPQNSKLKMTFLDELNRYLTCIIEAMGIVCKPVNIIPFNIHQNLVTLLNELLSSFPSSCKKEQLLSIERLLLGPSRRNYLFSNDKNVRKKTSLLLATIQSIRNDPLKWNRLVIELSTKIALVFHKTYPSLPSSDITQHQENIRILQEENNFPSSIEEEILSCVSGNRQKASILLLSNFQILIDGYVSYLQALLHNGFGIKPITIPHNALLSIIEHLLSVNPPSKFRQGITETSETTVDSHVSFGDGTLPIASFFSILPFIRMRGISLLKSFVVLTRGSTLLRFKSIVLRLTNKAILYKKVKENSFHSGEVLARGSLSSMVNFEIINLLTLIVREINIGSLEKLIIPEFKEILGIVQKSLYLTNHADDDSSVSSNQILFSTNVHKTNKSVKKNNQFDTSAWDKMLNDQSSIPNGNNQNGIQSRNSNHILNNIRSTSISELEKIYITKTINLLSTIVQSVGTGLPLKYRKQIEDTVAHGLWQVTEGVSVSLPLSANNIRHSSKRSLISSSIKVRKAFLELVLACIMTPMKNGAISSLVPLATRFFHICKNENGSVSKTDLIGIPSGLDLYPIHDDISNLAMQGIAISACLITPKGVPLYMPPSLLSTTDKLTIDRKKIIKADLTTLSENENLNRNEIAGSLADESVVTALRNDDVFENGEDIMTRKEEEGEEKCYQGQTAVLFNRKRTHSDITCNDQTKGDFDVDNKDYHENESKDKSPSKKAKTHTKTIAEQASTLDGEIGKSKLNQEIAIYDDEDDDLPMLVDEDPDV